MGAETHGAVECGIVFYLEWHSNGLIVSSVVDMFDEIIVAVEHECEFEELHGCGDFFLGHFFVQNMSGH